MKRMTVEAEYRVSKTLVVTVHDDVTEEAAVSDPSLWIEIVEEEDTDVQLYDVTSATQEEEA